MQSVSEFEYSQSDLLGHGAFALVFKGRQRKVRDLSTYLKINANSHLVLHYVPLCVFVDGGCRLDLWYRNIIWLQPLFTECFHASFFLGTLTLSSPEQAGCK